jgi:hypothetical protein
VADEHLTDERLQELYERGLVERGTPARLGCVSPEAILALVRREGAEPRRLETLDHVMACAACRGEFELLRSIERAGEQAGAVRAPARASRPTLAWRQVAPFALAASVLLVAGVGVWRQLVRPDGPEVERGASDSVTLLAPGSDDVVSAPVRFAWRAVPGARRYELEVLDADGTPVYALTTGDTIAVLPDVSRLTRGAEYHWWVRATEDAGTQRSSPMRPLRAR